MRIALTMSFELQHVWPMLLYVGPDLLLPLTSALAAIAGVLLMFWHRVVGIMRAGWRMLFQRDKTPRA
jgi:hypothetical protein